MGLGTSSPVTNLTVYGTASVVQFQNSNTGSGASDGFYVGNYGGLSAQVWQYENDVIMFGTNNTERMRIDSSGRLLIGSTSARANFYHSTVSPHVQQEGTGDFDRQATIISSSSTNHFGAAFILAHQKSGTLGGNTALVNGDVSGLLSFQANDGSQFLEHARIQAFVDGASGTDDMPGALQFSTAGDGAQTVTERMRIDSSGRLLLGVTSNYANPNCDDLIVGNNSASGTRGITIGGVDGGQIAFADAGDARAGILLYNHSDNSMRFYTSGASNERMRIDSSGNVGLGGITNPSFTTGGGIHLGDNYGIGFGGGANSRPDFQIASINGSHLSFRCGNGADTADITMDTAGRLLVGTTTSRETDTFIQSYRGTGNNFSLNEVGTLANGEYSFFRAKGGASGGSTRQAFIGVYKHAALVNPGPFIFLENVNGGNRYYWTDNSNNFRSSDTVTHIGTTSGVVIGTQTSDERVKNVGDNVSYGLTEVLQLQPKQYALKSEPDVNKLGFIAQEVESIIPEAVFDTQEELEGHQEGDRTKLGMEYVQLIPVLVNAIKEQQTTIAELQSRLSVLEG